MLGTRDYILVPALLITFFIMIFTGSSAYGAEEQVKLTYKVTINPGETGRVEALLEGLSSSSVEFRMSTVDQTSMKRNISNFSAQDPDGNKLSVSSSSNGWQVSTNGNDNIVVNYEFGLEFSQSGGRRWQFVDIGDRYGLFYNEAIFAYPETDLDQVFVEYNLPEGWGVGIHFIDLGNNRFQLEGVPDFREELLYNTTRIGEVKHKVTKDYGDLTMSFFVFQPPQSNYGLNEFWRSYYGTTPEEEMEKYLDMTYDVIKNLTEIFGYWPGGSSYIVTTRSDGDDLHSLTGFKYWIQAWTRERHPDVHHHVAHAWIWRTGLSLSEGVENWMEEGIPTYYQAELPYRMENDDMWLGLNYLHHLVLKRAGQFGLLNKHTVYTYAQNHMRVLALDRAISDATGGRKGLDDLMYNIGQEYGLKSRQISSSEMIKAINEVAEADLSGFYNRHMAGKIAREIPPVEEFIDDYRQPFFKWVDTYVNTPGNMAGGSRTMLFIALEMGLYAKEGHESEHFVSGRANLYVLSKFRDVMAGYEEPFTEDDIVKALRKATGANHSDFFDFYTVGNYRPSAEEVTDWFNNPPKDEELFRPVIEDRSVAYIEPSTIEIGVPTELKLVVKDPLLVSEKSYVRVSVELDGDTNLGSVLHNLSNYIVVDNLTHNGVTKNFEAGMVQGEYTDGVWEGSFTVTLPDNFMKMQIQAEHVADHHYELGVWLTEPAVVEDTEEAIEEEIVEEVILAEQGSNNIPYPIFIAGILLPVIGVGGYFFWRRRGKLS